MKVVIGSNNTPKRNAVENSFKAAFPAEEIEIETISTNSGVSSRILLLVRNLSQVH